LEFIEEKNADDLDRIMEHNRAKSRSNTDNRSYDEEKDIL
jgi:hypothetical protein